MRKSLLFLASAALFASCSSDLLESDGFQATNETGKGVTFQIVDDAATRGMIDTDHSAFFFAEKDRISVWAKNAHKGYNPGTQSFGALTANNWNTVFTGDPVTYKATSSKGNPNYTSIDDANMLDLPNLPAKADFFVAYPYGGQTVADAGGGKFTVTPHKDLLTQKMNGYMNIDSRLMYGYEGGLGKSSGIKEQNKSVGETVNMALKSPLSTILFKYTNLDGYKGTELGQLQDVTITSWTTPLVPAYNGQVITIKNPDLFKRTEDSKWYVKSDLSPRYETYAQSGNYVVIGPNTYIKSTCQQDGSGEWHVTDQSVELLTDPATTEDPDGNVLGTNVNPGAFDYDPMDVLAGTAKVNFTADGTFTYNTANKDITYNKPATGPLTWKGILDVSATNVPAGQEMNLFVLPVERDGKAEKYTVTFNFKNADLVEERSVTADFEANRGARTFTLDIAKRFPYIVTKGATAAADRTLYINSSQDANGNPKKVRSIINNDGSVNWLDQFELEKVDKSLIKKVVIKAGVDNLEKADWDALNKLTYVEELVIENNTAELLNVTGMTALKKLTAKNITTVNPKAFSTVNGNTIIELSLPNVNTWNKPDPSTLKFTVLQKLDLHSYEFSESQIANVQPETFFNINTRGSLIELDLSAVKSLAPLFGWNRTIKFDGYKLENVTLNNTDDGVIFTQDEFKGCTNLVSVIGVCDIEVSTSAFEGCSNLTTVHIKGDRICANAFKGSKITNVYKGKGNTIAAPTYIGASAFENATSITYLDLKNATEIGVSAFNGALKFGDDSRYGNNIVSLYVNTVKNNAFNGTAVKRFQLISATETKPGSLNSNAVIQIKYLKDLNPLYIDNRQVDAGKKSGIEIFGVNAEDMDIFIPGYKTYTIETTPWQ